ncbi:MAG: hypothetical protein GF411_08515 [Candidatus Lokiarchaeota archaeon]|nr:hypothetical protein [Candidatus Lokiarchaeota archaeon]
MLVTDITKQANYGDSEISEIIKEFTKEIKRLVKCPGISTSKSGFITRFILHNDWNTVVSVYFLLDHMLVVHAHLHVFVEYATPDCFGKVAHAIDSYMEKHKCAKS